MTHGRAPWAPTGPALPFPTAEGSPDISTSASGHATLPPRTEKSTRRVSVTVASASLPSVGTATQL
ncbi:MAG: hypothetical protein ACKORY_07970, partial [Actinomycetota bacterium]